MRATILGVGAIGLGTAALLLTRGHEVVLFSPTGRTRADLAASPLVATGVIEGRFEPRVAGSLADAIEGASAVVVAVPGNGQRAVIERLAPLVRPGQAVAISAMASLSGIHLARLLRARGVAAPIAALGTTVLTARRTGPGAVSVLAVRPRLDLAAIPASEMETALGLGRDLFGDVFEPAEAMATAFANVNSVTHVGLSIANATRIELAEDWAQYRCMTEAVSRLILALDAERLAVAGAFGAEPPDVETHIARSFSVERAPLAEMARVLHARRGGPPGPRSMDTRFVVEDVPFGAAFTGAMGRIAGVPTPRHDAAIDMLSTLWGRDLRAENDLIPVLGLERMDVAAIRAAARGD
jgi:opine dehydrogenase